LASQLAPVLTIILQESIETNTQPGGRTQCKLDAYLQEG